MVRSAIFVVCVAATLLGCDSKQDKVLARVGDREITDSQFNAFLKVKRIPEQNEKAVEQALADYLEREAMAEAIAKEGLLADALIQAEINEFQKQLLISRYLETYLDQSASEQALRNYYSTNADEFSTRKTRVAHILIRTNKAATEVERQAQLTRAHEAYSQVVSGQDFAVVAENYSEDTQSAKNGGDLGWIVDGAIDPKFSEAAFSLQKGQVSEPLETSLGFHIIKAVEEPQAVQHPFENVKGDIRYRLRQEAKEAEIQRLRANVKVTRS